MKLIYAPRSVQASKKLVYCSPKGPIELIISVPVDATEKQIEWLKSKYKDFAAAIESREIIVIPDVPEAGASEEKTKKPPKTKAALSELQPPPQVLED